MTEAFDEAIWVYLDGTASPDQVARLDAQLRSDEQARVEFLRAASLDHELTRACCVRLAEDAAPISQPQATTANGDTTGRPDAEEPRIVRWTPWFRMTAAAAALCMISLGIWQWTSQPNPTAAGNAYVLTEVRGVATKQGTDSTPLTPGMVLLPGDWVQTGPDGHLRGAYPDGTTVEYGANSLFSLHRAAQAPAKAIHLERGTLASTIRKQVDNCRMAFITPHAVATVLGTTLRLAVTSEITELIVQTGTVSFAAADQVASVASGESAIVRNGVIIKSLPTVTRADPTDEYEEGAVLFQDSFANGLVNWTLYTAQGNRNIQVTSLAQCPDIRIVRALHNGVETTAAELVGRAPEGKHVGIQANCRDTRVDGIILSYEYTFDGRPRRALEGMEIDMNPDLMDPPDFGQTRTQPAKPAGEWNKVRWIYTVQTNDHGRYYADARLYFNGEFIGRRSEQSAGPDGKCSPGATLEVKDGQFRFTNVEIRELRKKKPTPTRISSR